MVMMREQSNRGGADREREQTYAKREWQAQIKAHNPS